MSCGWCSHLTARLYADILDRAEVASACWGEERSRQLLARLRGTNSTAGLDMRWDLRTWVTRCVHNAKHRAADVGPRERRVRGAIASAHKSPARGAVSRVVRRRASASRATRVGTKHAGPRRAMG